MAHLDYATLTTSDLNAAAEQLESWSHPDLQWSTKLWSELRAASPEVARYLERLSVEHGLPPIDSLQGGESTLGMIWEIVPEAPSSERGERDRVRPEWYRFCLAWRLCAGKFAFERRLRREKLESLRQLAYGASHEINNPLANISTRAQALLTDEQAPERRHKLAAMVAQAFRAHEMIANLMLFARPPEPVISQFDSQVWLERAQREWLSWTQGQGTELSCRASLKESRWEADPDQLTQLISALVRNSCEALGAGGTIEVVLEPAANCGRPSSLSSSSANSLAWWHLSVKDSGPGFSESANIHAFDPFYSGREAGRGLGFGLSKCWVIATAHGGTIEIASAPGATTVLARMPIGVRRATS